MIRSDSAGLVGKLVGYGAVGLVGTLCHYMALLVLVEVVGAAVLVSTAVGFVLGAVVNHELNRRYVFKETGKRYSETVVRFMTIAALGFCMNMLIMYLLNTLLLVHYLAAQILATGVVFLASFVLNKSWTFST